jgi:23S rRNA (guanosine2251-2'-O)-methyltransferase
MNEYQWIEGPIAVESVIQASSRDVRSVIVREDRFDSVAARIQQLARDFGIPVERVSGAAIDELASRKNQTVIAEAGPRRTKTLQELFEDVAPVIVFLDGVEDPYNFGQAVRALYAAGIDGLIVRRRDWLPDAAMTVIRASAGATEYMPTSISEPVGAVQAARSFAMPVAIATSENASPMYMVDLSGPLLLFIGGEKRGIARSVQRYADSRVSIPYGREFSHQLGTVGAAAVLAFEVARQRRAH